MSQHRVSCPPQLEVLEQRQVLSGLAPLLSGASLTAVTTSLLGQSPRSESTTPSQVSPMIDLAPSSTATTPLSGGLLSLSVSVLTPGTEKTASDAPQGLLNLGLQVNVGLPGLLDVQAATNVAVGGETQGPALAVGVTAAASLGGGTVGGTGQATPLLNLGLALNLPGGTTTGSGGTSSGAEGTSGQVTIHIPITPDSVPSSGTDSAVAAAASTSLTSVFSPMVPTAIGVPPQAGLSTLTQTSALVTADEDVQLAINSLGRPEQGKPQQEKDAVDEIKAAPESNLLPGRPASSSSPTSANTGEESEAPRGSSVIPLLEEPEALDAPDGSPWFFQLPETLGLGKLCPKAFGPINNLTAVFLEDLTSMPRRFEQVMEWMEADGFSASSWLLLGMAGIAACEVARRQFRDKSSTDALGGPAEGPALV
jgi:hypothetical protein